MTTIIYTEDMYNVEDAYNFATIEEAKAEGYAYIQRMPKLLQDIAKEEGFAPDWCEPGELSYFLEVDGITYVLNPDTNGKWELVED